MTKVNRPQKDFADFASQMARNPATLASFNDYMEEAKRKREIGSRMAAARSRRGLTQPQTAERAGVGSSASAIRKYQNWEAGKHLPGHETLEHLAEVLGISYDYLMTGGEEAPPAKDILKRLDGLQGQLNQQNAQAASPDEMAQTLREIREELTALSIQVALIPAALGEILEALKPIQDDLSSVSQQAIGQ